MKIACQRCRVEIKRHGHRRYCDPCAYLWNKTFGREYRTYRATVGNLVQRAVESGLLPPPKSVRCHDCGEQGHGYDHRDYERPLDVHPVCISCNARRGSAAQYRAFVCAFEAMDGAPHLPQLGKRLELNEGRAT